MCCSGYIKQPANRQSPFSYFSLFGLCFDQACKDAKIKANCQAQAESVSTGNMADDTAFVADCIQRAQGASGSSSTSSSSPDTLNQGLTALQQILCIADPKNCPNKNKPSGQGAPPPPAPKPPTSKFLGMPAPLGIGVALAGTAVVIWGIVKLSQPKTAPVVVN